MITIGFVRCLLLRMGVWLSILILQIEKKDKSSKLRKIESVLKKKIIEINKVEKIEMVRREEKKLSLVRRLCTKIKIVDYIMQVKDSIGVNTNKH